MNNFIRLYYAIFKEFHLNGNDAIVYALALSLADRQPCRWDFRALGEQVNLPDHTMRAVTARLENAGLIFITRNPDNNVCTLLRRPADFSSKAVDFSSKAVDESVDKTVDKTSVVDKTVDESSVRIDESSDPTNKINYNNNYSNSDSAHTQAESFVQNGVQAQADLSYPSLPQLLAYADSQHIDPELAQVWFRKMTASGWRMSHGDPVKNWQRCLDYYIRNGLIKRPRPAVASEGKRIGELLSASRPGPITDDPESPNYCNTPGVYLLPNQIAAEQKEEADRRQAEEDKKAPDYEDYIDSIVRRHTHGHASLNAGTQAQKE